MTEYKTCKCGSRFGREFEDGVMCLTCWDKAHGIKPEPVVIVDDSPRIYDMTTGRALPGHPGLA